MIIAFVGTGEKGFKTMELRLIGPSLIGAGILIIILRIMLCVCPSKCFHLKKRKQKFKNSTNKLNSETVNRSSQSFSISKEHVDEESGIERIKTTNKTNKKRVSIAMLPTTSGLSTNSQISHKSQYQKSCDFKMNQFEQKTTTSTTTTTTTTTTSTLTNTTTNLSSPTTITYLENEKPTSSKLFNKKSSKLFVDSDDDDDGDVEEDYNGGVNINSLNDSNIEINEITEKDIELSSFDSKSSSRKNLIDFPESFPDVASSDDVSITSAVNIKLNKNFYQNENLILILLNARLIHEEESCT